MQENAIEWLSTQKVVTVTLVNGRIKMQVEKLAESRQAAIDVVGIDEEIRCEMCRNPMHTDRGCDGGCTYDEKLYKRIMQILDERIKPLPSAQPERKKGKWIYDGDCYICNQCMSAFGWWADSQTSNYCPNCGADMRGEQDGH